MTLFDSIKHKNNLIKIYIFHQPHASATSSLTTSVVTSSFRVVVVSAFNSLFRLGDTNLEGLFVLFFTFGDRASVRRWRAASLDGDDVALPGRYQRPSVPAVTNLEVRFIGIAQHNYKENVGSWIYEDEMLKRNCAKPLTMVLEDGDSNWKWGPLLEPLFGDRKLAIFLLVPENKSENETN